LEYFRSAALDDLDFHAGIFFLNPLHPRIRKNLDTLLLERLLQFAGNLLIRQGENAGEHLHDGYFRSKAAVDRGKFHSHRAGPDNHD